MKLDKIKFAEVLQYLVSTTQHIFSAGEMARIDDIIDVDIPIAEPERIYPLNENVEALMKFMAGGTNKIDAIREHRRLTGFGLKESKEAVERYWPDSNKKSFSRSDLMSNLKAAKIEDDAQYYAVERFIESLFKDI